MLISNVLIEFHHELCFLLPSKETSISFSKTSAACVTKRRNILTKSGNPKRRNAPVNVCVCVQNRSRKRELFHITILRIKFIDLRRIIRVYDVYWKMMSIVDNHHHHLNSQDSRDVHHHLSAAGEVWMSW